MTTLEKFLRGAVISGIFALPFIALYVASGLFFPYITGKNFLFRIIVEVITALWLSLALVVPAYRPRRSYILGAFALFVAVIALADAHGVNPFKSFWSNYERMDGWITIAHLLAYTVVAASVLTTEKLWQRLFRLSLALSVYFAFYGFAQMAGITALGAGGATGFSARIDATFGNPIYLAVYMLFNIFLAAMLWAQSWEARKPGKRLWLSFGYGSVILIDTLALIFTGTRGTVLGLVGGVLVSAALIVLLSPRSRIAWRGAVASLVGLLILVGGFYSIRNTAAVQDIGFLKRLATISTSDNTVQARFMNWGIAWQGIQERPILGWGQENYAIVFDKYYDPGMYAQEQWFDRVHNIIFDWLVAGGFLGLLSYLVIFVAALLALWRSGGFTVAERSILTGLLAGYFFHNLFVFDNVTSYILFGTVLAFIVYRSAQAQKAQPISAGVLLPRAALPGMAVAGIVLAGGLVWSINAPAYAANRALIGAIGQQNDIKQNLAYFKESISYGAYGTQEAREQLAQAATQMAGASGISNDVKQQFVETAVSEMRKQEQVSPLDARFPLFLGSLFDTYGAVAEGQKALERAHELSPKKQTILFEMAANAQARSDTAGMMEYFKQAYELDKSYADAKTYYAAAAIQTGQAALADTLVAEMIEEDTAANPRIAASYILRGQLDKPLAIWRAHLAKHPTDVQSSLNLAAAYYQTNHPAQAIAALQDAADADPAQAAQIEELITSVRNGTAKVR